ncbi:MAG: hypothetical protein MAG795_00529 [Candidatus Woesearchaeota archaeon]|nr:hypothetical protein [Candidatus Woesearchaeota archaeon]
MKHEKISKGFSKPKKSKNNFLKCPSCEKGKLSKGKIKKYLYGEYLGEYPVEKCNKCGESFLDSSAVKKIEEKAKQKGLWGLGFETKITKTGNSLAVRIPKKIADHMKVKDGKSVYVHPGKNRIIIDL